MEVEGGPLTSEEFSKDSGWQTVAARGSRAKSAPVERAGAISTGANPNDDVAAQGRRDRGRAKAKIIFRVRREDHCQASSRVGPTVVAEAIWNAVGIDSVTRYSDTMCPNFQQNIMVVSTPSRENATRYVKVECIAIGGQQHEVNAYEAAPHSTCKGVIRGIAPSDGPEELDCKIVTSKNPQAMGDERIKNTGTVVVVFDGYKVPNYVSYGGTLVRCALYRKQVEVCYACGRLGHRADVCSCPDEAVCRGCGIAKLDEQHKCRLCGGRHLTAAKECQVPDTVPRQTQTRRAIPGQQKQVSGLRLGRPTVPGPRRSLRESLSADYRWAFRTPFQAQKEIQIQGHIRTQGKVQEPFPEPLRLQDPIRFQRRPAEEDEVEPNVGR
ncbi:hypothetical protein HPB52_006436 [Rhipicephalus sanguineus]|uniref:CCHC-type domain-containing protein n=1 Tax=Rhipicephalus sanguineus TaxID=34632 RepID=A0A9D4Q4Z8_RHISA|nr:hypothetical protein HPB52_006436 [Rhipicephalus sanguineus]